MPDNHNAVVIEMRRFNRFYTHLIGLLEETLTRSVYTLAEARVLFELGHRSSAVAAEPGDARGFLAKAFHLEIGPVASEIADELRLDPAYLTRILRKFSEAGLTEVRADPGDRRRRILSLTVRGRAELAGLQAAADRDVARLTAGLGDAASAELSGALKRVMRLLGGEVPGAGQIVLRPHRIGDIGWVIQRQAALYGGSMAGAANSRRFSPRSAGISSAISGKGAISAGLPSVIQNPPARFSWCMTAATRRWRNCACCMSSTRRAAWASAGLWSKPASNRRALAAMASSPYGPTISSPRRAGSTSVVDLS